jgi:molecular chaperone GrpE (heat shock protein)
MRQSGARSVFISFMLLLTLSFFGSVGCTAWADDVKTMLQQANKELRQAQKYMFAGKTDNAIAALDKIEALLVKAKAADPNNSRIKTLENKYSKLVKDLERRTGKGLVAAP